MTASDGTRKINLVRPAHAYYKYKDIETAKVFLEDFGFNSDTAVTVKDKTYYRGYGKEPWVLCAIAADKDEFWGVGFVVESEDDLEYAATALPNATKVHELEDAPGGGKCVTFFDPGDGFPFHLVYGQKTADMLDIPLPHEAVNYPTEKHRPVNKFQRFQKRPAPVHKLGHFGVCVTNYQNAYEFYSKHFNLFPSELVHDETGIDKTVFYRLARGSEEVDHHCFFFYEGPEYHPHHTSYETHDFDTQVLGHDWLREKGYKNCWGVGRHVMGSQIFDYWFDPAGFIMEHYVDGDVVDDKEPTHRTKASPDSLHVWGPDVPADFLK